MGSLKKSVKNIGGDEQSMLRDAGYTVTPGKGYLLMYVDYPLTRHIYVVGFSTEAKPLK